MKDVILINGAWVTPRCWFSFMSSLATWGYRATAPAWPYKTGSVEEQLVHPDPRLADVGIPEVVAHYEAIIRAQDEPPFLIGHSFGGLIVQLLLDRGLGSGGVAISSVPPRGVPLVRHISLKGIRTLFRGPLNMRSILRPPEASAEDRALRLAQGIETHLVPESRRIFRQLFLGGSTRVDFGNAGRAPLLIVACGNDTLISAETNRRNYEAYRSSARTDFALFPELTHVSIAEPGFEDLAACCVKWMDARIAERETSIVETVYA